MSNRLVALIKDKQASLTKLRGELADLEKARALLDAGTDSSALAALWQRSGGAHVLGYRSSKNGKIYRRLVLWVGTWASAEELLALKVDVGGTVLLAPRRRWIATGRLARRLCQEIFPHVEGWKKERLRDLLAAETSGCASPKVKAVRPKPVQPPPPVRTRLPKASPVKEAIPAAPIPARETPAPPPAPVVLTPKKDPVPALGLRPAPIAPQRGPWRVVDAQGVVLAEGPDRRRAEELAEVLGGSVVPAGQTPSNST